MLFEDVKNIPTEFGLLLEKRKYEHRKGYKGNEKGSYINKGKTKWDYSIEGATPGNERIVTQILNKIKKNSYKGHDFTRQEVKKFLKSDKSQKIFDRFKKHADAHLGNPEGSRWRGYVFGGFTSAAANAIISEYKNKDEK